MRKFLLMIACACTPAAAQNGVAQTAATMAVRPGSWSYSGSATGSEASFVDSSGVVQLAIRCTRANRSVLLSVRGVPTGSIAVWTSSASRTQPATFDAPSGRLNASLAARDPLLDAIAFSRGRFSVTVPGAAPLVVPTWPEPARAIEDCRN